MKLEGKVAEMEEIEREETGDRSIKTYYIYV